MPIILDIRKDIEDYLNSHGLGKKWDKAKRLFESNPSHPSLHTELLELRHRGIYSFRIDKKFRAIFIHLTHDRVEIIAATKHYHKG